MDKRAYLSILASGVFAVGVAGCDAGDPGDPATPEPESSAMYDAEEADRATDTMADAQTQAENRLQQNQQQAEQRLGQAQDGMAGAADSAMDSLDTLGSEEIVGKAVRKLNDEEILLVNLYYHYDHTTQEIAFITKLSVENVKVKLHRIRKKLLGHLSAILKNELNDLL